jgi:hypothetical protein
MLALALGGLDYGYRELRNRKVNEALVQGAETARAVLATTPQGQAADAQFVKWLMEYQKEAGVFATVSDLVSQLALEFLAAAAAIGLDQLVIRIGGLRISARRGPLQAPGLR